jgi:hypothetical protein
MKPLALRLMNTLHKIVQLHRIPLQATGHKSFVYPLSSLDGMVRPVFAM